LLAEVIPIRSQLVRIIGRISLFHYNLCDRRSSGLGARTTGVFVVHHSRWMTIFILGYFLSPICRWYPALHCLQPALSQWPSETVRLCGCSDDMVVNWQKTMVQALGPPRMNHPVFMSVADVQRVKSFVYLWAMIHSSCSSDPEICRHSAMTHSAVQSLDWHLWRSCITTETKLHLYRVFILLITLDKSECWAINKADLQRIDALDQWCFWRILGIHWHAFVRNAVICHTFLYVFPCYLTFQLMVRNSAAT